MTSHSILIMENSPIDPPPVNDLTPPPVNAVTEAEQAELPLVPLMGIPFPPWLMAFTAITVVAFVFGLARIGHAFGSGIAYERAERQLQSGKANEAIAELKSVADQYPNSMDVKIELITAYSKSDHLKEASELLQKLVESEVKVSDEQATKFKQADENLDAAVDRTIDKADRLTESKKYEDAAIVLLNVEGVTITKAQEGRLNRIEGILGKEAARLDALDKAKEKKK